MAVLLAAAPSTAGAAKVEVPVDVGVGPAGYLLFGPVFKDQPVHFGLKLNVAAVLDKEFLKRNQKRIPKQYRKTAGGMEEVRFSPSFLIPDALIISPKIRNTGFYGVTWRPLGLGVPVGNDRARLSLGAGLLLTGAVLHSDVLPTTVFLRPGLDLKAEVELKVAPTFLISFGWASGLYIPQKLGGFGLGGLDDSLWHFGQAFIQFHFRFPYKVDL